MPTAARTVRGYGIVPHTLHHCQPEQVQVRSIGYFKRV